MRKLSTQESALISEGVCPMCEEGKLIFEGNCIPANKDSYKKPGAIWRCEKCNQNFELIKPHNKY